MHRELSRVRRELSEAEGYREAAARHQAQWRAAEDKVTQLQVAHSRAAEEAAAQVEALKVGDDLQAKLRRCMG